MDLRKENIFSSDNILRLAADDKKSKKGDGVTAILGLFQDIKAFSDKVEAVAEAQDITEYRQKLEAFGDDINKHLEILIDLAKVGIKSIRQNSQGSMQGGSPAADVQAPSLPSTPSPIG